MEIIFESLREHAMKIINFKKKKIKLLTNNQEELYKDEFLRYLKINILNIKNVVKLETIAITYRGEYRGDAHSIWNLKDCVPKEIPIAFHNGSNHDYHSIIKELAEERKGNSIV